MPPITETRTPLHHAQSALPTFRHALSRLLHPVLSADSLRAQYAQATRTTTGRRAGAWTRYGFHDDGFPLSCAHQRYFPGVMPPFAIADANVGLEEPLVVAMAYLFDIQYVRSCGRLILACRGDPTRPGQCQGDRTDRTGREGGLEMQTNTSTVGGFQVVSAISGCYST